MYPLFHGVPGGELRARPVAVTGAFALDAAGRRVSASSQWSRNSIAAGANSWWYWKIAPWPELG